VVPGLSAGPFIPFVFTADFFFTQVTSDALDGFLPPVAFLPPLARPVIISLMRFFRRAV
jgi:hypothetical protein